MFSVIYPETPAVRLVDWLEFQAIVHEYHEAPLELLLEAMGISEDGPVDAFDDDPGEVAEIINEDTVREDVIARAEREIERRLATLNSAYPFFLEDSVLRYVLDPAKVGQLTYLLCLRLSLPLSEALVDGALPLIDNTKERALFQHCANYAAAGYLGGKVYAFGWPRPDKTGLLEALRKVEDAMESEGKVRSVAPIEAPGRSKDDEIDVIAWIPLTDGPGGALTVWGQVASGKNWLDKPLSTNKIEQFRMRWYEYPPRLMPSRFMFIPFSIFDEFYDIDKERYTRCMLDKVSIYGTIIHRYRLPVFVDRAFSQHDDVSVMEGLSRDEVLGQLAVWYTEFEQELNRSVRAA